VKRLSSKAIFERIRWDERLTTAGEQWKANNNYTAYYARMFMLDETEFMDIFETRWTAEEDIDAVIQKRIAERRKVRI